MFDGMEGDWPWRIYGSDVAALCGIEGEFASFLSTRFHSIDFPPTWAEGLPVIPDDTIGTGDVNLAYKIIEKSGSNFTNMLLLGLGWEEHLLCWYAK